jgi:hypothetical protein
MTRILALFAALAGLTVVVAQGAVIGVNMSGMEAPPDYFPFILQAGRWAQLAFIALTTLFLLLFALTNRSKA